MGLKEVYDEGKKIRIEVLKSDQNGIERVSIRPLQPRILAWLKSDQNGIERHS